MTKWKLVALLTLLFSFSANAQDRIEDSLLNVLKRTSDLKTRTELYNWLAGTTMRSNTAKGVEYARKTIEAANELGDNYWRGVAYTTMMYACNKAGKIDDGIAASDTARMLLRKTDNLYHLFYAELMTGSLYRRQANYDESLEHYMNCVHIAEEMKNDTLEATAYSSLGGYFVNMGDLDRAEGYHRQALALRLKIGDPREISQSYDNLGILNRDRGRYDTSLMYYWKAMEYTRQTGDSSDVAFLYNDIGAAYSKKGDVTRGEQYLKESIAMRERMQEMDEIAYTYNYLGENYERKGDLPAAQLWIKKALQTAIDIGNNKQHYEALESLSDFYARNNMWDSAYHYSKLYKHFRDSIARMDNETVIAELTTQYETEKKERKIQEQQFELSRRNYMLIGLGVIVLLGALLGYSGYRRYKLRQQAAMQDAIHQQQQMAAKSVIEAEERERRRIATDLHDGVGQMMSAAKHNLSALKDGVKFENVEMQQSFDKALALVDESCSEVRTVSHNIMPNALLKSSLATAVREFLDKIDSHSLKINLYTEGLNEKIDENTEIVLYRVIQECVNNVIKHSGANKLDISLVKDEDGISATIEDNGKGFEARNKYAGMGLQNIRSRIEYLNGTVEWDSAHGRGTVVMITLPKQATT